MTIEHNLARYREMAAEIDKVRAEHPASMVNHEYDTTKFVQLKSNILPTRSILRDLETAVEVIKVLREAMKMVKKGSDGLSMEAIGAYRQALALAAKKMGEPTSRSE